MQAAATPARGGCARVALNDEVGEKLWQVTFICAEGVTSWLLLRESLNTGARFDACDEWASCHRAATQGREERPYDAFGE